MRVAFVTLASEDYFLGATKLFASIKEKTKSDNFDCILFTNDIADESIFSELFDEVRSLPATPKEIVSSAKVPRFRFTLNKLYILEFLKHSSFDRVIFLDSDLMCLSTLEYLLNPKLNKYDFLAARDFACGEYYSAEISELGLDPKIIFNTGCFILNRSILKTLNYEQLISTILSSTKSYDGGDQGYFNFMIQNSNVKLGTLPLRFNYPLDTNYPSIWMPPSLVHFSGEKPWSPILRIPKWDRGVYKYWECAVPSRTGYSSHCSNLILSWWLRNFRVSYHIWDVRLRLKYVSLRKKLSSRNV